MVSVRTNEVHRAFFKTYPECYVSNELEGSRWGAGIPDKKYSGERAGDKIEERGRDGSDLLGQAY